MQTVWISRYDEADTPPDSINDVAERLEISPFLANLLWRRGFRSSADMELFLSPGLRHLAPLESWPGLFDAARIIADTLLNGKTFAVWGDYDVDGITSSALVADFCRMHGFEIVTHIPDRIGSGYGLNKDDLRMLREKGVDTVLTVDCGISDVDEVAYAREIGLVMVVSDHHLPGPELPPANALCAPTVGECAYPYLAGVGVAFMLMGGVNNLLADAGRSKADIRSLLDLVALGTLADVAPMKEQNRILVKNGLLTLAEARRPGIAALKAASNYSPTAMLGAGQVVFTLAPRINAAGRMGKSNTALQLLLTADRDEAARLAADLVALNTERRSQEDDIVKEARIQALQQVRMGNMGLVLYAEHWHMGIIGIVASRIVEETHRPAVILCRNGDKLKGSARSVEGFDLHDALSHCSDLFLGFGGHKMAAGMSLLPEQLAAFQKRFDDEVRAALGDTPPPLRIRTDGELDLARTVDFTLLKELELLQPFGMGNSEPVFVSPPLVVKDVKVRSGLVIMDVQEESGGVSVKAKLWRPNSAVMPELTRGRKLRMAFSPRIDRYNGAASVELRVKDWYPVV